MERVSPPLNSEILLTKDILQTRVKELAEQIFFDYSGKNVLLIPIKDGSIVFFNGLIKHLTLKDYATDSMTVKSYGKGTKSENPPRIIEDIKTDITGRHVLLIEDIVDSGHTMETILALLTLRDPASIEVCTLLSKSSRREVYIPIKYIGFEIEDKFVFGYGLDLEERLRELPNLYYMKPKKI